jgi:tetratricopeptide (TPR) repeat protein
VCAVVVAALIAAWSSMDPTAAVARGNDRPPDAKAEAQAKEHVRKATEALRAGRYDEATAEFEAGYAIVPLPAFILNMARAQRQAGNLARARGYYQQYLTLAPESPDRSEIKTAIAEIDAAVAAAARAEEPKPAADATPVAHSAATGPPASLAARGDDSEVPPDLKLTAREPIRRQQDDGGTPFYRQWWFWGTAAGVIVAAAVAVVILRSRGDDYATAGTWGTLGR